MMKKILFYILGVFTLWGCIDEPQPMPDIEPVSRTVLVYMVASNNLGTGRFDDMDIAEMELAAAAGDLNGGRLVVFHHSADGQQVLKEITPQGVDTLKVYDQSLSSVESSRMLEVFDDMRQLSPADDYGLVLWSHANGWLQDGLDDELDFIPEGDGLLSPKAFGYDRGRTMNITTLARALNEQQFSFVYFDCCYMGSVEVVYELRETTKLIVGSPSELPSRGMPYDQNISCFFAATPDLVQAAKNTFAEYDSMDGSDRTCTMTVINTSALDQLAQLTARIYSKADEIVPEGYTPQPYMMESRCYHYDLGDYVRTLCDDRQLMSSWEDALAACVVYEAATPQLWSKVDISTHCGLSTYIFSTASQIKTKGYNTTSWYVDVARYLPAQ